MSADEAVDVLVESMKSGSDRSRFETAPYVLEKALA